MVNNDWLKRELIETHSLDMRQFMDFRESTLTNGTRIIEAYNSSGLTFTLLPDRGMDIWTAHYNGMPLTWIAPGSPHPPDYGKDWLSMFNGGLLTTCGLTHVGPAEDGRDIHGNFSRQRARVTQIERFKDTDDLPVLRLRAEIKQSQLFGEQLNVTREYRLTMGQPRIQLIDTVKNVGDAPVPFMMMYHCNLGYPLVREGTELLVASDVYPRDATAQAGVDTWQTYEAASVGYPEQVFFHHVKIPNWISVYVNAALVNENMGLKFQWVQSAMPYLTQWKNTRQGIYVCGIEPGNCIPEGQNAARESGRLVILQPGETQDFMLTLEILDGAEVVQAFRAGIESLKTEGTLIAGCNLTGYERYEAH
jgi:galactose mutarotase-like enzyme